MKVAINRWLRLFLVSALLLTTLSSITIEAQEIAVRASTVSDRDDAPQAVKDSIARIIALYTQGYRVELLHELDTLESLDTVYHTMWADIVDYWDFIESEMLENIDEAPSGLENPSKHAFIVLGFALNDDGTMKDELVGRLEVAKASALKYPETYILVTGGVEKNGWTEGRRMRDWLIENGIEAARIIVEEAAPDTAGNATNSFDMLYNDYDVDTVSIISSQYHIKRASILYYTESLIKAYELNTEAIVFLGNMNAGWYREDLTSESMISKANSLRTVARVPNLDITDFVTEITGLNVAGNKVYHQGEALDLKVYTIDSKNYQVDITQFVSFEGFDSSILGKQDILIRFVEREETYTASFEIEVLNTSALELLLEDARQIDLNLYTDESVALLQEVILNAKTVLQAMASQEEIDTAYEALQAAMVNLELFEEPSIPEKPVDPKNPEDLEEGVDILPDTGIGSIVPSLSWTMLTLGSILVLIDKKKR